MKRAVVIADINSLREAVYKDRQKGYQKRVDYLKLLSVLKEMLLKEGIVVKKTIAVVATKVDKYYENFRLRLQKSGWNEVIEVCTPLPFLKNKSYFKSYTSVSISESLFSELIGLIIGGEFQAGDVLCLVSNQRNFALLTKTLKDREIGFKLFCYTGPTLSALLVKEAMRFYGRESIVDLRPIKDQFVMSKKLEYKGISVETGVGG